MDCAPAARFVRCLREFVQAADGLRMPSKPRNPWVRPREARRGPLAVGAIVLDVILGLGALGGGGALMFGPRGEFLPLPVSLLGGSPFDTYGGRG